MGKSGADGIDTGGSQTHNVPGYEDHADRLIRHVRGVFGANYDHGQRYTYLNVNLEDPRRRDFTGEDIGLRNIVTKPEVDKQIEVVEGERVEQKGGLYFEHGYDAHTPKDIVAASGYENVNMDEVAEILVNNAEFELKMTGHADTSGDADRNQALSENRLQTAEILLLAALQRQGLSEEDAKALYDERVAPHSTIIALGESEGPIETNDEVKEQGNRVVSFDLFSEGAPEERVKLSAHKGHDMDNHEHVVVVNLGTGNSRDDLNFIPDEQPEHLKRGQFAIADESTHFAVRIDENRVLDSAHEFTINYKAENNLVADNTNFVIEHNEPGAVTSAYNFDTGNIDISVNGQVAVNINLPDNIDPAVIKVGQITSEGAVTISPLTNLDDVAPISELRTVQGERNVITNAADAVVNLSIDAKHIFMEHDDDPAGYKAALEEYGFLDKLDEAFFGVELQGIDTKPYKALIESQFVNAESAMYNPSQVVFPFQTFQGLYESEVSLGHIEQQSGVDAYDALVGRVDNRTAAFDGIAAPDSVEDPVNVISAPGGMRNN